MSLLYIQCYIPFPTNAVFRPCNELSLTGQHHLSILAMCPHSWQKKAGVPVLLTLAPGPATTLVEEIPAVLALLLSPQAPRAKLPAPTGRFLLLPGC